jgi:uncharacterized SAM-dependent methyltransferase
LEWWNKTVYLKGLIDAGKEITYIPLDISANVLETIENIFLPVCLMLKIIESIAGDLRQWSLKERKIRKLYFYGFNIGNGSIESAHGILELVKST